MFWVKNNTISLPLQEKFSLIQHNNYPTNFSKNNQKEPKLNLMITKFAISPRGPRLQKKLTTKEPKGLIYDRLVKNIIKNLLLSMENGITYF